MVDQRYQQSGIGRVALNLALNEIKASDKVKEIEICYDPENPEKNKHDTHLKFCT